MGVAKLTPKSKESSGYYYKTSQYKVRLHEVPERTDKNKVNILLEVNTKSGSYKHAVAVLGDFTNKDDFEIFIEAAKGMLKYLRRKYK